MDSKYKPFDFDDCNNSLDEILNSSDSEYSEVSEIPTESKLTFDKGYYVDITALFIDLRDSKGIGNRHNKPRVAKIYKSFISEAVSVIRSSEYCKHIYIEGDCVWGVFDSNYTYMIDECFEKAALLNSLINLINKKINKLKWDKFVNIKAGIGISYANSLLIKAGKYNSGINETVWIGRAVGEASRLSGHGNKGLIKPVVLDLNVYEKLKDEYKRFCYFDPYINAYHCDISNIYVEQRIGNM